MKKKILRISVLVLALVHPSLASFAQPADPYAPLRILVQGGKLDDAVKLIQKLLSSSDRSPEGKAKLKFALGIFQYRLGEEDKAAQALSDALRLKTKQDDIAEFYLGQIERDKKDLSGARKHFETVKNRHPASIKLMEAEVELARIAKAQERWGDAYNYLRNLERRYRHDADYPSMLYDMTEIAFSLKKRADGCRYAVMLYSKFPTYVLPKGWGFDLTDVRVKENKLSCTVSFSDREKRMHALMLAGEFDEVRNELKTWRSTIDEKSGDKAKEELAKLELQDGQLALAEGKVKEAILIFNSAQEKLGKRNFTAQMLLAKAYSQTDDYAMAVKNYMLAYDLSPRSKLGLKALFQAAFLSYQNRDYDGAAQTFDMVMRHARGKVAFDARWHLAWIRYLKADYEGALKDFRELQKNRLAKSVDLDKINYWMAMCAFRLGLFDKARASFALLSQSKRLGYYTAAAMARLVSLGPPTVDPSKVLPLSANTVNPTPPPSITTTMTGGLPANSGSSPSPSPTTSSIEAKRDPANEESLPADKDVDKTDDDKAADDRGSDVEETSLEPENEAPPITDLKNPLLVERFEKAQDLIDIGFESWAQGELREVEKRTSRHGYLQTLMMEYMKAGDFYRSAYLADVIFENERTAGGVEGAQRLWSYAFPQAYNKYVTASAKKFDVSASLIWSIMRGESGFRQDIHSQAGAIGLMQLIPPTAKRVAKDLGIKDFSNGMLAIPETNIQLGVRYLRRLSKTMADNMPLTIASYNAGPHRVQGWLKDFGSLDFDEFIEHIPYMETRNYVKKVLRNYEVYQLLYEKKVNALSYLSNKPTIKFEGPKPLTENWEDEVSVR